MDTENIRELNKIINLLSNTPKGLTIKKLSETLNVPMEVIRKDFETLTYNEEFDINLFCEADLDGDEDEFSEDVKWFINKKSGEGLNISISPIELMSYELFMNNIEHIKSQAKSGQLGVTIKNNNSFLSLEEKHNLAKLEKSVASCKVITIAYKNKQSEVNAFKVCPLGIVYYEFEGLWYFAGYWKGDIFYYRLDRVKSVQICDESFEYPAGFKLRDKISNMWGMEFGKEYKVKVKFKNHVNVFDKVRRDLYNRKNGRLYEEDGFLFYEDTVIGINSFKRWIRGFGSSAVVLEPLEVREEIIKSAKESYELYVDEKSCP